MSKIQIYYSDEDIRDFSIEEVRTMLDAGELTKEDYALIDEWGEEWGAVGDIPEIDVRPVVRRKKKSKVATARKTRVRQMRKRPSSILIFLLLILILGATAAGFYFFVPSVKEFVYDILPGGESGEEVAATPSGTSGPDATNHPDSAPRPTPAPPGGTQASPMPPATPGPKLTPEEERAVLAQYPYKDFPSLEAAVGNWQRIPTKLFPLQVGVVNEVTFGSQSNGSVSVPSGGNLFVISQRGPQIMVRPSPGSRMQTYVGIDDTTLKHVITQTYNTNVKGWHRLVDNQRQDARDRILAGMPTVPTVAASTNPGTTPKAKSLPVRTRPAAPNDPAFGTKPEVNQRGQVTVALASIRANGLADCQEQFIQRWGVLKQERIQGRPYWTVEVSFLVDSIFGRFPKDAKALIRNGRLEKWVVLEDA